MSSVTTKLKDMIIDSPTSKEDNFDKRSLETRKIAKIDQAITPGAQPTTYTLPSLVYDDLSPQEAMIWQQLPAKDKELLISATSKQHHENNGKPKQDANDGNQLNRNGYITKYTCKCCHHRGTPNGELLKFWNIVDHHEMDVNNKNYSGSPYVLTILWENGQVTDVPLNQLMHDSPRECTKYVMNNGLNIYGDDYDRIPVTTQLTHTLMKLALNIKGGNVSRDVPLAIELYDAFNFKLLLLDITDSNRLMVEIHNNKLNDLLESIHQRTFHQRTIQQLMILISEAQKLQASTYTTPSEEIFNKDQVIDDDKELDDTNNNNEELREVLLQSALDMKKTFQVQWTNEVFAKFLAI